MGRLIDRGIAFIETVAGPFDWTVERNGTQTSFAGRFLIFDRRGVVKSFVHGRIIQRDRRQADVYLYDPPEFTKKHRHGRCMQLLSPADKWFKLHFEKPASDFAAAYTYVEHFLTEAYRLTH